MSEEKSSPNYAVLGWSQNSPAKKEASKSNWTPDCLKNILGGPSSARNYADGGKAKKSSLDHPNSPIYKIVQPTDNNEIKPKVQPDDLPPAVNYCCFKVVVLLLILTVSISGTVIMWFTDIYSNQILQSLTLKNGTELHNSWRKPPLEPLLCVYVFNYTNTEAFMDGFDDRLKIEERGPYCYRETIEREFLEFDPNGTLSYRERRTHVFDLVASKGYEEDILVVPNIPILAVFASANDGSWAVQMGIYSVLRTFNVSPFTRQTARAFIFGYSEAITNTFLSAAKIAGKPVPFDKFGILVKRAGLSKDTVRINTGDTGLDQMGQVTHINGQDMYSAWLTDECNAVSGSDGVFFVRSLLQEKKNVGLFHKDSCRTLPLQYDNSIIVDHDIEVYRYKLRDGYFDMSREENQCYNTTDLSEIKGIFDVSKCVGAPMVFSMAHFLGAEIPDENLLVTGLAPDVEKHDMHIDIYPPLALTVRTLMRLQINVVVKNEHESSSLGPLKHKTILPVVWVEMNSGEIPERMIPLLYHITYTMRWGELFLMWALLLITCILLYSLFIITKRACFPML